MAQIKRGVGGNSPASRVNTPKKNPASGINTPKRNSTTSQVSALKKNPAPKLVIPKKWRMPNTPGPTARVDTLPVRPGDKPKWVNLSKTVKATNRRTAR
jgi:hypothetical protein